MRVLVTGYDSIGQLHARLLTKPGHEVAVTSRRSIDLYREIVVNTDDHTVGVELVENTMEIDGQADRVHVIREDT